MAVVVIPKENRPAYHLLTATDLATKTVPVADVSPAVITNTTTLSGTISLVSLTAGQPITIGQVMTVADSTLISGTVAIAVEGGPALAFGGQLQSGAVVSVWAGEHQILDRVLVLDVKRFEANVTPEPLPRYVVILALLPDQRNTVMAAAANGTLSFSFTP